MKTLGKFSSHFGALFGLEIVLQGTLYLYPEFEAVPDAMGHMITIEMATK